MVISSARHSILKILSPVNRDFFFLIEVYLICNVSGVHKIVSVIYTHTHTHTHTHIWAHSNILAGRIPGTEEPGGLQSMGSQRVGQD